MVLHCGHTLNVVNSSHLAIATDFTGCRAIVLPIPIKHLAELVIAATVIVFRKVIIVNASMARFVSRR